MSAQRIGNIGNATVRVSPTGNHAAVYDPDVNTFSIYSLDDFRCLERLSGVHVMHDQIQWWSSVLPGISGLSVLSGPRGETSTYEIITSASDSFISNRVQVEHPGLHHETDLMDTHPSLRPQFSPNGYFLKLEVSQEHDEEMHQISILGLGGIELTSFQGFRGRLESAPNQGYTGQSVWQNDGESVIALQRISASEDTAYHWKIVATQAQSGTVVWQRDLPSQGDLQPAEYPCCGAAMVAAVQSHTGFPLLQIYPCWLVLGNWHEATLQIVNPALQPPVLSPDSLLVATLHPKPASVQFPHDLSVHHVLDEKCLMWAHI